jgi:formate dehydrogenase subunit gamma
MVRGTVTYGWARKHHPRWFEEVVRKSRTKPAVVAVVLD